MIRNIVSEYITLHGKSKLNILHAIICYYRVPKFRVTVLIQTLQHSKSMLYKKIICKKLMLKYGVDIGLNSIIGTNLHIEHFNGLVIGNGVVVGNNCTLYHNVTLGQSRGEYPTIKNNVTIYPGAIVLGNITIGENSKVLAGAIVLSDVPSDCIVAGIPAVVKKFL